MSIAPLSLKGRALRLLSAREYSRAELERKLASHAPDPHELTQLLEELCAKGFISEERVLQSVLHQRAAKLGSSRVVQELQRKGVPQEMIAQAQEQLQNSDLERANVVWQKKFASPPASPADYAKQVRFLASRGFAAEVIRRVLQSRSLDTN